ncbi:Fas-binding factor 1 [Anthophora quadrimaculata]
MVDYTETSNANLEDITKALGDMNSLDMELFNDSFKKSKSTSIFKDSNIQSDGEIKKKVIFKDSNEDELLTGLSDEEASLKEKKNLFTSGSKSSLMEDLFKIKSPITSTTSIKSSNETEPKFNFEQGEVNQLFSQKSNSHSSSRSNFITSQTELLKEKNIQKLKNVSKNEEDILGSLIDKSDVLDNKSRRSSLRETLFENKSYLSNTMNSIIPRNIKKMELENKIQSTNIVQESKSDPTDISIKPVATEPRRGRRNTKILNDPLGLLSADLLPNQNLELLTNENVSTKESVVQSVKTEKNLPEWLGGSKILEDKMSEAKNEEATKIDKVPTSKENTEIHDVMNNSAIDSKALNTNYSEAASIFPEHFSLLIGTQLNQQNALMNMQQQEHELKTATILSQQNKQLGTASSVQNSMLCNQEEQFNALLKLQLERQSLLEKQINLQQERINQYIHALMTQPITVSNTKSIYTNYKLDSNEKEKEFNNEKEMESVIQKLRIEKAELESKLSVTNEKHIGEITFQAEFYERQISFLKEVIRKLEEKVKQELEYLETDYITKLEKLKDEKLQIEKQYKEDIHNLKNEHIQHIEEFCKLHSDNVKLLQKEYSNVIENISKAKQTEDHMVQTMTNRKTEIDNVLQKANYIMENIVDNKEQLEIKHNEIKIFQENTLKIHEDIVEAQRSELKHQNSVLEEHRNRFVETTEKLDIRLTQLITEIQKQNELCNAAHKTLEKKVANLLREKELFEEEKKWERDYMQSLKESWMKEQDKQLKLCLEEKKKIAAEKSQLEVLSKLKSNSGEIAKVELEAAIKTAQEATVSANREKLKWREKMNELNIYKQILQDKENVLILRAKELENLTQSALIKKEEAKKALQNAKHLDHENKEKFNQLQIQIQALMEREKRVATEKYNATNMISLAYKAEKPERDISVLHNSQNNMLINSDLQTESEITTGLMNIVDPNLIMLKLNLNEEFDSINKYI